MLITTTRLTRRRDTTKGTTTNKETDANAPVPIMNVLAAAMYIVHIAGIEFCEKGIL